MSDTLVIISDLHGDARAHGKPRFEEFERVTRRAAMVAIERKAAAFLFLGDLCDPDSGAVVFRCQHVLADAALQCAQNGVHVVLVAGNHDVCGDGLGTTTLTPLWFLENLATPEGWGVVRVVEQPRTFQLGHLVVHALPYTEPRKSVDLDAHVRSVGAERRFPGRKNVVLFHGSIPGLVPGEEATEMPRGREVVLPARAIRESIPRPHVFCGHVHKRQWFECEGLRGLVVGAAMAMSHGEEDHDPGFVCVTI